MTVLECLSLCGGILRKVRGLVRGKNAGRQVGLGRQQPKGGEHAHFAHTPLKASYLFPPLSLKGNTLKINVRTVRIDTSRSHQGGGSPEIPNPE